jgi:hypothetical protein
MILYALACSLSMGTRNPAAGSGQDRLEKIDNSLQKIATMNNLDKVHIRVDAARKSVAILRSRTNDPIEGWTSRSLNKKLAHYDARWPFECKA